MQSAIALLGGTFNPPHRGHIECALDTLDQIGVQQLGLMPCKIPPHKCVGGVAEQHRVNMVKHACMKNPRLYPELIELGLPTPSYTVKTLSEIRKSAPDQPILFLLGEDSLYNLDKWYEWHLLTDYCHLIVMRRKVNQAAISATLNDWVQSKKTESSSEILSHPHGHIFFADSDLVNTSSSELRMAIEHGQPVDEWIYDDVIQYIQTHNLYAK